jgi:hypothetical protein
VSAIPAAASRVRQNFRIAGDRHEYSFSPGAGLLRLHVVSNSAGNWWTGDFVDYRGIVSIQMEATFLRLDTVAQGRCHVRTYGRRFGERTVAKLCRAFLTDLHGAPTPTQDAEREA